MEKHGGKYFENASSHTITESFISLEGLSQGCVSKYKKCHPKLKLE